MVKGFLLVLVAYVMAGVAAVGTAPSLALRSPIVVVAAADVAATVVIFIFSVIARNSSVYDPYWSVAPIPIALYWLSQPSSDGFANPRHMLIFALVCLWALRLTTNWAYQWRGLGHEDWRYRDIKRQTGRFYWPVSFLGIHLMPTVLVFVGLSGAVANVERPEHATDLAGRRGRTRHARRHRDRGHGGSANAPIPPQSIFDKVSSSHRAFGPPRATRIISGKSSFGGDYFSSYR